MKYIAKVDFNFNKKGDIFYMVAFSDDGVVLNNKDTGYHLFDSKTINLLFEF